MKRTRNWILGVVTTLTLGLAAAGVSAHPSHGGGHAAQDGGEHRMQGGMGHGMRGHHGMRGQRGSQGDQARHGAGRGGDHGQVMRSLFTDAERTVLRDKMRAAKTPEERRQIAQSNRAEVQKRAQERGITLPERHGSRGGFGQGSGTGPAAPSSVIPQ